MSRSDCAQIEAPEIWVWFIGSPEGMARSLVAHPPHRSSFSPCASLTTTFNYHHFLALLLGQPVFPRFFPTWIQLAQTRAPETLQAIYSFSIIKRCLAQAPPFMSLVSGTEPGLAISHTNSNGMCRSSIAAHSKKLAISVPTFALQSVKSDASETQSSTSWE